MLLSDNCLSDVCLSVADIEPNSNRERGLGRLNWHRGSPRHTWLGRTSLSKSTGQRSRSPDPLLTAMLVRQAAAAVGVGTC